MMCLRCHIEGVVYRQVNRNGAKVVVERCPQCRRNTNKKFFLPAKEYDWDSLPLFVEYDPQPCAYYGCKEKGTEYHHFAPRHLFDDADYWPIAYLCIKHHTEWHKRTKTGVYRPLTTRPDL